MYKVDVQGELAAIGWREGASGRLTGTLDGLFEGTRMLPTDSSADRYTLTTPQGNLAVTLNREVHIRHLLPPRPPEHPFANGNDPLAGVSFTESRLPDLPQQSGQGETARRNMTMVVRVVVDQAQSTGMFAGAGGDMVVTLADPTVHGQMKIETADGTLMLTFRERMEQAQLCSDLDLDGERSTGRYHHAHGQLQFFASVYPPHYAKGRYAGTLWLEQTTSVEQPEVHGFTTTPHSMD